MWRSTRLFLLVWSLLLAPQAALVHALSHSLPNAAPASQQDERDDRHHHTDKVCDACLAFAQIGTALPAHFSWSADHGDATAPPSGATFAVALRPVLAFHARAPPATST